MMHTTTDRAALLQAILADPDDDGVRLAFADLLEEEGETERAEFIRVQVEIARLTAVVQRWIHTPHDKPGGAAEDGGKAGAALAKAQTLGRRERELMLVTRGRCEGWSPPDEVTEWVCRRGFVESVTCTAADFLRHADALLAFHPITEVRLTTWPEVEEIGESHYALPGRHVRKYWEFAYNGEESMSHQQLIRRILSVEFPRVRTWHLPGDAPE